MVGESNLTGQAPFESPCEVPFGAIQRGKFAWFKIRVHLRESADYKIILSKTAVRRFHYT